MTSVGRYIWASPNSLVGLLFVPIVVFGRGGIQLVDGVIELYGPLLSLVLRHCVFMPGGASAMTLGHVVLGRDRESLSATRAHERVHVRQYERWGPAFMPAYLLASVWALMSGAGPYYGNRFEREALENGG